MERGEYREALRLAAKWANLGRHRDEIRTAWAALTNRNFYVEIGKDPDDLVQRGISAIRERYKL